MYALSNDVENPKQITARKEHLRHYQLRTVTVRKINDERTDVRSNYFVDCAPFGCCSILFLDTMTSEVCGDVVSEMRARNSRSPGSLADARIGKRRGTVTSTVGEAWREWSAVESRVIMHRGSDVSLPLASARFEQPHVPDVAPTDGLIMPSIDHGCLISIHGRVAIESSRLD